MRKINALDHRKTLAAELVSALRVGIASAAYAGFPHFEAVTLAAAGIDEPMLGPLDAQSMQLCP